MASKHPEVRIDLRFEIYGSNYICYHVCLDCFGLFWTKYKKEDSPLQDLSASLQLKTSVAPKSNTNSNLIFNIIGGEV